MRLIALLALLLPSLALAQVTIGPGAHTGPRILGEVSTEYCPMLTHGKCTDGKTITTTRSTPVPCGSGTAGVDVGCYQGGLGAWGQVVNYCTNSTDPRQWTPYNGTPVITGPDADGWWGYEDNSAAARGAVTIALFAAGSVSDGSYTATVEAKPGTYPTVRMAPIFSGGGSATRTGGDCDSNYLTTLNGARRYTCTFAVTGATGATALRVIFEMSAASPPDVGVVYVKQAQVERSPTPGRRCDAGATPATCDGDKHLVSTTGWPTTQGSISSVVTVPALPVARDAVILDTRTASGIGFVLYIGATGRLESRSDAVVMVGPPVEAKKTYVVRMARSGGTVRMHVNGSVAAEMSMPNWTHRATAVLGQRFEPVGGNVFPLNGTISRLEWSNQ